MSDKTYNGIPVEEILKPYVEQPDLVERIANRKVSPGIFIVEPNPEWPSQFEAIKSRILAEFGQREPDNGSHRQAGGGDAGRVTVEAVNHIGSTSVPGLPAKNIIDIDLVLSDNLRPAEAYYVPRLEAVGFQFLLREPAWGEHRFFAASEPVWCNLHVWGPRNPEVERHLIYRNHLRAHDADRDLYAATKRECAARSREAGENVNEYTNRKSALLLEILGRAFKELGLLP